MKELWFVDHRSEQGKFYKKFAKQVQADDMAAQLAFSESSLVLVRWDCDKCHLQIRQCFLGKLNFSPIS